MTRSPSASPTGPSGSSTSTSVRSSARSDLFRAYIDIDGAVAKLAPYLKRARIGPAILGGIKPTEWETLKTEAIDFNGPFIWLDDAPLPFERRILEEKGGAGSLVEIDWRRRATRLTVRRLERVRRSHGRKTTVEHIE